MSASAPTYHRPDPLVYTGYGAALPPGPCRCPACSEPSPCDVGWAMTWVGYRLGAEPDAD